MIGIGFGIIGILFGLTGIYLAFKGRKGEAILFAIAGGIIGISVMFMD